MFDMMTISFVDEQEIAPCSPSLKFDDLCAGIIHMDNKKLDANLLISLEALLAERNVTKAADRLGISQPALSAQLKRLRDLFGDPLLLPAQRGMIPTKVALALEEPLHRALEGVREVVAAGAPFDPASATESFSVAGSDYIHAVWTAPFAQWMTQTAPQCRIACHAVDRSQVTAQLERGEIDVAFLTPEAAPDNLRSRKLLEERYVVIGRADHPKLKRQMDLGTFCALDHVLVSPRGGAFEGATDIALAALGTKRRVALSVASFLLVPEIVRQSDMIALVPQRLVAGRKGLFVSEPPLDVPGFTILMLWHDRTTNDPAQRWLRQELLHGGGGLPPR
jgi:DNA-binding transcriptional LysR family regulator